MNATLAEIADAAKRLGYTSSFPADLPSSEFLYLHGRGKKHLVNKTKSPFLSSVQAKLVTDKFLSGEMLQHAGLPVAAKIVMTEFSDTAVEFLERHREVIVKPNRMDRGVGVTDRITDLPGLKAAFDVAAVHGPVIIEKQVTGKEYRVLVIDGKAVAALERKPLILVGNGRSSIRELIFDLNRDPRRGYAKDCKPLRPIDMGSAMELKLRKIGLSFDFILEKGQPKQISFSNHLDSGGIAFDCTDIAAAGNLRFCEDAAKLFKIDVAGIDLICEDIAEPVRDYSKAAILEVNPGPDILWHMYPTEGESRPVADMFVRYVFSK